METAKGSILLAARESLEQTLSPADFQQVLAGMPSAARELIDSAALVPSGRYPMARVAEMLVVLGEHWGATRIAHLEALGSFIAARQLNGMLRFFLRLGSVEATIAMLPRAWELFFQGSSARVIHRTANSYESDPRSFAITCAAARARASRPSAAGRRARLRASVPAARACA